MFCKDLFEFNRCFTVLLRARKRERKYKNDKSMFECGIFTIFAALQFVATLFLMAFRLLRSQ